MNNFENLEIQQQKLFANSDKYFELFDKYLNGSYKNCLLYMIGNVQTIAKLMRKNTSATYYVYDNGLVIDCLKNGMPDYKNFHIMLADERKISNDKLWEGMKRMKFDRIIMNPPYSKNLHLKVLEEAIKHLTDDGTCVNLSPVRWLQDPLAKYKKHSDYHKFEESVSKHIETLDIVDTKNACDIFDAGILMDLGIYTCNITNNNYYINLFENKIIDKIYNHSAHLSSVVENDKIDGWRWTMCDIQPMTAQTGKIGSYGWFRRFCIYNHLRSTIYYDGFKDNKEWIEFNSGIKKDHGSKMPHSIHFNSESEALNFENSLKTTFYHYCVNQMKMDQHTPWNGLPWMGDQINPRTRLKGYESEWTDEDFYKFFEITEEEQKIIEETMAKYK